MITGNLVPDHTTNARLRSTHARTLAGLFTQVLQLCGEVGLVKVATVAVDVAKMAALVSLGAHRTSEAIGRQVDELFEAAAAVDADEDALSGSGQRGDEVPERLWDRTGRRKRLAAAKARLKAEEETQQAANDEKLAERETTEHYRDFSCARPL